MGRAKPEHVKGRIEGILNLLQIPCLAMFAAADNWYRKPRPGMLELVREKYNQGMDIELSQSVYVGDAAGRRSVLHKDHSSADLLFAINTGLPFLTPEQFVAKQIPKPIEKCNMSSYKIPSFDPRKLKEDNKSFAVEVDSKGKNVREVSCGRDLVLLLDNEYSSNTVMIIFAGIPGSGKSSFFGRHFKDQNDYYHINRDTFNSMDKCEREVRRLVATSSRARVVIDNTNSDCKARERWVALGRELNMVLVAIHFDITADHAQHNNYFRRFTAPGGGKGSVAGVVPIFVIRGQANKFEPPTLEEGFRRVFKVSFVPQFESEQLKHMYHMFFMDK
jgi:bifunctional polynucleotide phosphatase/kinase